MMQMALSSTLSRRALHSVFTLILPQTLVCPGLESKAGLGMVPTQTETVLSKDLQVSPGPPALYKPRQSGLHCKEWQSLF